MPFSRTLLYSLLAALVFGILWISFDDRLDSIGNYVQNKDLLSLETRFQPDEIMEMHKDELIGTSNRTYQEPVLLFHPYLLLRVKYFDKNHKTKESAILWSELNGEMVINTDTWEQTKGFAEAINAGATPLEFRLLNALAANKGPLNRDKLMKELHMEQAPFNALVNSLKQKQLIVIKGNDVLLHLENPRFHINPETKMESTFVVKPVHQGKKLSGKYGRSKIENAAKAAFGEEFTVMESEEIFLPVFRISLQNLDGSTLITDWNAITGKQIPAGSITR